MARELTVRGNGEATAMPDRADVHAVVEVEAPTSEAAYGEAARLCAAVDQVVARYAASLSRASTAALIVNPTSRWKKGEAVKTGWRAARTTLLQVVALDELGKLLGDVVEAGAAVGRLAWEVEPGNAAYVDACRVAAQQAKVKAEAYAGALGVTLGPVAWMAEPGLRVEPGSPMLMRAAPLSAGSPAEEPMSVTPQEVTVRASLDVGFEFG